MHNDIKEIVNTEEDSVFLSRFKEPKYALIKKKGRLQRLKYLEYLKEELKDYITISFDLRNGNIDYIGDRNKLKKYLFLLENKKEPSTVKGYALIHDTHNSKINEIREKEPIFIYKEIETNRKIALNDEIIEGKLIIVENNLIFGLNKEEWIYYLENFETNFNIENSYVLFGSGNAINSSKIIPFLKGFSEIIYLGDLDDKGYEIYKRLNEKVNMNFIFPKREVFLKIQKETMEEKEVSIKINNATEGKEQAILPHNSPLLKEINERYSLALDTCFVMNQEVFTNF